VFILVLRRKDKRRYILLYVNDEMIESSNHTNNRDLYNLIKPIKKRFYELFGSIELEKANIYIISKNNFDLPHYIILKCNLESIENVLSAISLTFPPLTTIKISGTLKKLTSSIAI
jgi:RNase P/RNase MRP subunit POP5